MIRARGWQYSKLSPSPTLPAETTAYFGRTLERNPGVVEVSLP